MLRKLITKRITKNRILAGLVNFDQLLLSVKVTARTDGSYVTFKFHITKNNTLFTIKIRVSTFRVLFKRLQKIARDIDKDVKENF